MSWSGKRKPIYDLGDISDRLGLNLMDVGTLIVEHDVRFCTPVAGLPVELGRWEEINLLDQQRVPVECQELTGLVDLRPQDAIAVLRDGSTIVYDEAGDVSLSIGDTVSLAIDGVAGHLFDAAGVALHG